jgi:hypothetical protein
MFSLRIGRNETMLRRFRRRILVGVKARIPTDRPMDGYSQTSFLLGKQKKSNREHVVIFVGTDVWSVKWRNMKIHFKTAEGTTTE